jgi:hypothetical protein
MTEEKFGKKGTKPAPIKTVCFPSGLRDGAVGTDIADLCVIEFDNNVGVGFFKGTAYGIDPNTVTTSQVGHGLLVSGTLKDKTTIVPQTLRLDIVPLNFLTLVCALLTRRCAKRWRHFWTPLLIASQG